MRNVYVIYSVGRTGSHFIRDIIASNNIRFFHYPIHLDEILLCRESMVIHSHTKKVFDNIDIPCSEIILILSKRKNEFARIMSYFISINTKEWYDYSYKHVDKFEIPLDEFYNYIIKNDSEKFYTFDKKFKKIIEIYYEDIKEKGEKYIASMLDIDNFQINNRLNYKNKSPYSYQTLVINWKQLYSLFVKHQKSKN